MGSRIKWVWDFHLLGKHIHLYAHRHMCSGRNAWLSSEIHISFSCCFFLFVQYILKYKFMLLAETTWRNSLSFGAKLSRHAALIEAPSVAMEEVLQRPLASLSKASPRDFAIRRCSPAFRHLRFPVISKGEYTNKQTHTRTQTCDCMFVCVSGYSTFSHVYLIYTYVHIYISDSNNNKWRNNRLMFSSLFVAV